jgi:hypothetical protein
MTRRAPRTVLVLLWVALGGLSWGFLRTKGLAVDDRMLTHVSDLQSGGSDDDLCIGLGSVLATAALLWIGARAGRRRRFSAADVGVHAVLVGVQIVYVLLISIDDGSITLTLVRDRNWVLGAWLATLAALASYVAAVAVLPAPEGLGRDRDRET